MAKGKKRRKRQEKRAASIQEFAEDLRRFVPDGWADPKPKADIFEEMSRLTNWSISQCYNYYRPAKGYLRDRYGLDIIPYVGHGRMCGIKFAQNIEQAASGWHFQKKVLDGLKESANDTAESLASRGARDVEVIDFIEQPLLPPGDGDEPES